VILHKLLLGILLISLISCRPGFPPTLRDGPGAESPPEARQGWKDGCESGVSAYGSDIYKSFYAFKLDNKLVNNKIYYAYWGDAFNYCRQWLNSSLRNGLFGSEYSEDLRDRRIAKESPEIAPPFLMW